MTILTQSQRDEIEKRHESTLLIDWEQEFNPEAQPQSLSNALYCHQDRAALLASEKALRERLELTPECMGHDGIYCRDETIRLQGNIIAKLKERLERVQRIKPFVLADDQTFVIHYDELEQALEQDE